MNYKLIRGDLFEIIPHILKLLQIFIKTQNIDKIFFGNYNNHQVNKFFKFFIMKYLYEKKVLFISIADYVYS